MRVWSDLGVCGWKILLEDRPERGRGEVEVLHTTLMTFETGLGVKTTYWQRSSRRRVVERPQRRSMRCARAQNVVGEVCCEVASMRLAVEGTRRPTMLLISRTVLIVGCFLCERSCLQDMSVVECAVWIEGCLRSRICGRGVRLWMSKLEGEVLKKCVCARPASLCNSRLRRDRCPDGM